jgi:hypothetical protein
MNSPLRIAVLECDTPLPDIIEKYGRYGPIFSTLLETAAEGLGLSPEKDLEMSAFDVVDKQEYPDLEIVDAVLISGSSGLFQLSAGLIGPDAVQNTTHTTMIHGSSSLSNSLRSCSSKTASVSSECASDIRSSEEHWVSKWVEVMMVGRFLSCLWS